MKNGLMVIACSWNRRGEFSHGYCTIDTVHGAAFDLCATHAKDE